MSSMTKCGMPGKSKQNIKNTHFRAFSGLWCWPFGHPSEPSRHKTSTQWCIDVDPPSPTLAEHLNNFGQCIVSAWKGRTLIAVWTYKDDGEVASTWRTLIAVWAYKVDGEVASAETDIETTDCSHSKTWRISWAVISNILPLLIRSTWFSGN